MQEHQNIIYDADLAEIIRERINACLSQSAPLEVIRLEDELLRTFPDFRDRRIMREKITAAAMRRGVPMML